MLRPPFFGSLVSGAVPDAVGLRAIYDVTTVVLGCMLAAFAIWQAKGNRGESWARARAAVFIVMGALAVVGALAINFGKILGMETGTYYVASVIVLCTGFAFLAVGWFHVLIGVSRDTVAALVMAAFVISHVFGFFDALPREWESVLCTLYPALTLSMLCLLRYWRPASAKQKQDSLFKNSYLHKIQICTMGLILAELLCGALLRSMWAHGGVNYAVHSGTPSVYLTSAIIGVVFWFVAARSKTMARRTLLIGGIGLVSFVPAALLLAFMPLRILNPFVTGLYSALLVYLIALISSWGLDGKHSPFLCAAAFMVVYGIASGITSSVIPAVLARLDLIPADVLFPVSIAAGFVISLGMCIVLFIMVIVNRGLFMDKLDQNESALDDDVTAQPKYELSSDERHEYAMDMIAARYDLTERERETASLMARGYTAKHVAEELTVAVSTVKGYSKSIYRKMGIHRKDELIEIVKETKNQV